MAYILILVFVALAILTVGALLSKREIPKVSANEPLDISRWEKVERIIAENGDFILRGDAVNYGNGRPYKLHLKRDTNGNQVWFAEFVDSGEWYKTDIGKGK